MAGPRRVKTISTKERRWSGEDLPAITNDFLFHLLWSREKIWEEEDNRQLLESTEARNYRELAARVNYLAQDRIGIQYATKEICRGMCHPSRGHPNKLRRFARYSISVPRIARRFRCYLLFKCCLRHLGPCVTAKAARSSRCYDEPLAALRRLLNRFCCLR